MTTEKWKALSLRLPPALYERIKAAANEDRRPAAAWMRIALEEKLDESDRLTAEATPPAE